MTCRLTGNVLAMRPKCDLTAKRQLDERRRMFAIIAAGDDFLRRKRKPVTFEDPLILTGDPIPSDPRPIAPAPLPGTYKKGPFR